jgi:hypothetical protein
MGQTTPIVFEMGLRFGRKVHNNIPERVKQLISSLEMCLRPGR